MRLLFSEIRPHLLACRPEGGGREGETGTARRQTPEIRCLDFEGVSNGSIGGHVANGARSQYTSFGEGGGVLSSATVCKVLSSLHGIHPRHATSSHSERTVSAIKPQTVSVVLVAPTLLNRSSLHESRRYCPIQPIKQRQKCTVTVLDWLGMAHSVGCNPKRSTARKKKLSKKGARTPSSSRGGIGGGSLSCYGLDANGK